jgi:hypothetical protein
VKTLVCPGVNCYHLSGGVWLTKRSTMGNIGCRCCRYNGHAVTTMKRVNNRKCWMPLCVFTMLDILFTNPKCILPSHRTVTAAAVLNDLVDEKVDHGEYRMPPQRPRFSMIWSTKRSTMRNIGCRRCHYLLTQNPFFF